jgi:hypothetical protein
MGRCDARRQARRVAAATGVLLGVAVLLSAVAALTTARRDTS